MGAGKYRHRLNIQTATETNTAGNITRAWATDATVWAAIRPLRGRERFDAQQVQPECDVLIEMRYNSDVTLNEQKRITHGSTVYNIQSVINVDGRNRVWEILCIEEK